MERVRTNNKVEVDGRIRWKNTGGGRLYLRDKRKILPGETFLAYPHEISLQFRDTIKPLEEIIPKEDTPPPVIVEAVYTIKHHGGGLYNVLDINNKIVNDKALKKDEALEMVKSLEE